MLKRAQGILEYVIALVAVIAALIIMGIYVRGGLSGKIREAAETFGQGDAYSPNVTGSPKQTTASLIITNTIGITPPDS